MRYLVLPILGVMSACSSPASSAKVVRNGYVIAPEMGIWSRPNDNSRIIGQLHQHDTVHVTDWQSENELESGWNAIRFDKDREVGFVVKDVITPARFAHPAKAPLATIRENPGEHFPIIRILSKADSVDHLHDFDEKWAHICLRDGTTGFVLSKELEPAPLKK